MCIKCLYLSTSMGHTGILWHVNFFYFIYVSVVSTAFHKEFQIYSLIKDESFPLICWFLLFLTIFGNKMFQTWHKQLNKMRVFGHYIGGFLFFQRQCLLSGQISDESEIVKYYSSKATHLLWGQISDKTKIVKYY